MTLRKEAIEYANAHYLALTFDDVRTKPGHAEVMPKDVCLESRFSRNIPLKIPLASAAMDTVTEHKLAIVLAKNGGVGVLHRNCTPEKQAEEVARVKNNLNGRIDKPITVFEDEIIEAILRKRAEKGYNFHSFPVLSRERKVVGILTGNDFDLCNDHALPAHAVMTKEILTTPANTSVDEAYAIMQQHKKKVLPLLKEDGTIAGMYVFSDLHRIKSDSSKMYNLDEKGRLRVGAAIGVGEEGLLRLEKLLEEDVDVVVIDSAHGDSKPVIETLIQIKKKYTIDVVAGNIATAEAAKRLLSAGADGIKVGIGPGSICTTRIIAGTGIPQVTAIYECAKAADGSGVPVCGDGGMRYSGDVVIAVASGAHSCMMGSMLAGTNEAPGDIVYKNGRQWKRIRGMGSLSAMKESRESRQRYLQDAPQPNIKTVPEGVEGLIPYKGALDDILFQYAGGLRQGMGYAGARNIEELRQNTQFIRLTEAGKTESHPHDIDITEESPNYSPER